jgi:hypothetical protein
MKCLLSIKKYSRVAFIIRYGECNYRNKQFRVRTITILNSCPSYINFGKAVSHQQIRLSEILAHTKNPIINDWIEVIGCWLLQN